MENINKVVGIKKTLENAFFELENVIGVGVGFKIKSGVTLPVNCIKVYVSEKKPLCSLSVSDRVKPDYDGVLTDVEEMLMPEALELTGQVRPIMSGFSIGNANKEGTGTIGACVWAVDEKLWKKDVSVLVPRSGQNYILSNNHVLSRSGLNGMIGDITIQPGFRDGGTGELTPIGTLVGFVPIGDGDNEVDCAISTIDNYSDSGFLPFMQRQLTGVSKPRLGVLVQKSGRTTGQTFGTISDISWSGRVKYGVNAFKFIDQIKVKPLDSARPFTRGGDSGSLVTDTGGKAVGLLFAGNPNGSYAIVNKITRVEDLLGIMVYPRLRYKMKVKGYRAFGVDA